MTEEEVAEMMKVADRDRDGVVKMDDFAGMIKA